MGLCSSSSKKQPLDSKQKIEEIPASNPQKEESMPNQGLQQVQIPQETKSPKKNVSEEPAHEDPDVNVPKYIATIGGNTMRNDEEEEDDQRTHYRNNQQKKPAKPDFANN